MDARDLMTHHPAVVAADGSLPDAAQLMRTLDVGFLPVVDSDLAGRLVGVITDRDIVVRSVALGHGPTAKVHEHMSRTPLVTVAPDASVSDIAEKMRVLQVRRLPVVDDRGVVVGVIAQADLAKGLGAHDPVLMKRTLEAIYRPGALVRND